MRFKTTKSKLLAAAQFAASGIAGRSTLPVLNHLLIVASKDGLRFTGSNLDLYASANCEAEVSADGALCLSADRLLNVNKWLDGDIEAELNGPKVLFKSGSLKAELSFMDAAEFPKLPSENKGTIVTVASDKLGLCLRQVAPAMSDDESRYVLQGLLFQFKGNQLWIVGCDGRRLAATAIEHSGSGEWIVPFELATRLVRAVEKGKGDVTCVFSSTSATFRTSEWNLTGKLVEGSYPNWRLTVPKDGGLIEIAKEEIISTVQRAKDFTTERAAAVKLTFTGSMLTVTSGDGNDRFSETLGVNNKAGDIAISMSPDYLLAGLNAIQGDTVSARIIDELSPFVLIEDNFTAVIMPMRHS
jgi:DNA polymerase III subunit beta